MKKTLLLFTFVFIIKSAFAQKDTIGLNLPLANGALTYEKVFNMPQASKNLLYNNAKLWFIQRDTRKQGIQSQDSVLGRILGKISDTVTIKGTGFLNPTHIANVNMIIQIDCKDNRYRCRIFNLKFEIETQGKSQSFSVDSEAMALSINKHKDDSSHSDLQSINTIVENEMQSLYQTMAIKNDF
jgi:hypothetical protein